MSVYRTIGPLVFLNSIDAEFCCQCSNSTNGDNYDAWQFEPREVTHRNVGKLSIHLSTMVCKGKKKGKCFFFSLMEIDVEI